MNERLRSVIADTLGLGAEAVHAELSREAEAAWDSLNHLRLITAVEEAFNIKMSMAEIQDIATAGELERLVLARQGA